MEHSDLQHLGEKLREWNLEIKAAEAAKQEIAKALTEHWNTVVVPRLNQEIVGTGYFFEKLRSISAFGAGPLSMEIVPFPQMWWIKQDKHHGWVDYTRADRLTLLINATEVVTQLKMCFPSIDIRVTPCYPGYLDSTEDFVADVTPETERDSY